MEETVAARTAKRHPHKAGEIGVKLEPLTRLKTLVWVREVLRIAGGSPSRLGANFVLQEACALSQRVAKLQEGVPIGMSRHVLPPLALHDAHFWSWRIHLFPLHDAHVILRKELMQRLIEDARSLESGLELSTRAMPPNADIALYLLGVREPSVATVKAIAQAVPVLLSGERPFAGTDAFFTSGPHGSGLWRVLDGDIKFSREIIQGELSRQFAKSMFRSGLPFSDQIRAFYRNVTGEDARNELAVLEGELPNLVTEKFRSDVAVEDEEDLELAIDTWRSYFVAAVAFWLVANEKSDSFLIADVLLVGMLAGPIETIYLGSGEEIKRFVMGWILKRTDAPAKVRADGILRKSKRYTRLCKVFGYSDEDEQNPPDKTTSEGGSR
ncbi:hypothetical protein AWB71_05339 [Caballeronia peredens]|nr:hypothetical protein AWB71_05339 [Caballeronia peredens]